MATPITGGKKLRTKVADMNIGDYIAARYTTTSATGAGSYSEIGTVDTTKVAELNVQGDTPVLDGYVYLIKIAKGVLAPNKKLFARAGIAAATFYAALNADNLIYGKKVTIDTKDYLMRVPNMNECIAMTSTLDGAVRVADRYTNFCNGTDGDRYELIQENYNPTPGYADFATTPASFSYTTGVINARLVLVYNDDAKCTDLFH